MKQNILMFLIKSIFYPTNMYRLPMVDRTTNEAYIPSVSFKEHKLINSMQDWFENQIGKRKFIIDLQFQPNNME